jgi:UDPglucose--hexose-1-phosphate uridylyltransferase
MKPISELREDIVSGDWILVSTGRAHRPHQFHEGNGEFASTLDKCPFENPQKSGNGEPLLLYSRAHEAPKKNEEWFVQVIKNKFPAVQPHEKNICAEQRKSDMYNSIDGVGFHEVVITRDHDRSLGQMTDDEVLRVVQAYQERYVVLKKDACLSYISLFHNHGKAAGASLPHPHSQIIALPIIPPDVVRSLKGSEKFSKAYNSCVHCHLIEWEMKAKQRIVYENSDFVVVAPYASHTSYELRIYPKQHNPQFETITFNQARTFANALVTALSKLYNTLDNPAYNFFIHTAPIRSERVNHYHWHLEILPKISTPAGLELGTGVDVVVVAPEEVSELLNSK